VKAVFPKSLGEATLALYDITRDDILTSTQAGASTDNGQQKSKGIEFSTILHPAQIVDVNFNTAYTRARFGTFFDPNATDPTTGLPRNDTGLIPADIPATTANLWADVRKVGNVPLELGAGWRFVGGRYADNADATKLYNYSLFDAYASYHFGEKLDLTARGKNLSNKAFAQWADINYPTEIVLGSPRTFVLSFNGRF
jgi:iron complex outermembrane receptor protein